jgi:hypothetical protein
MHAYKKHRRACVPALSLTGRPDEEPRNGPTGSKPGPSPPITSAAENAESSLGISHRKTNMLLLYKKAILLHSTTISTRANYPSMI